MAFDISRDLHPAVCIRPVLKSFTLRGGQGISREQLSGEAAATQQSARHVGEGATRSGVLGGPDVVRLHILHANLDLRSRILIRKKAKIRLGPTHPTA